MTNRNNTHNAWDRVMAAISFAESGEHETAMRIINPQPMKRPQKRIRSKIVIRAASRPELNM
ncbi:MAG: hypothetical protein JRF02_05575 [Deltaproteobacteria bacterium]|nr:hypothetical protein [Deltaproteobacteria bacterium]